MRGQTTLFSSKSDEWTNPKHIIDYIEQSYYISIDLAATEDNAVAIHYSTQLDAEYLLNIKPKLYALNGVENSIAYCNPPYSQWQKFVKMISESEIPCIMLLPARTDTKAFHEFIYNKSNVRVEFIKGRLKFGDAKNSAPFPSMLVYFRC